ncbi:HET-domain-containing protein, partial [Cubamyces sp. BRFM 1775]
MRGTYTALSYVWGDPDPRYRTTQAKLPFHRIMIDSATLPRTIMDAVYVTRALCVNLLWIDSLCIIQDSVQDMHHELARMRDVYRHAFLTIDAGSAASVSEGFLHVRRLDPYPIAVLPLVGFFGDRAPSDKPTGDSTHVGTAFWVQHGKPTSHTVVRGWCLQERLLSTRSLVFTTQSLQLRCHTRTQNVGGAAHDPTYDVPRLPDAVFLPDRRVIYGSEVWKDVYRGWWRIVNNYSRRQLSDASDKLTAISALAEMFVPSLGPEYVAGLWRRTLLRDLLWTTDVRFSPSVLRSNRLTGYRAPSWSWASINGPVTLWNHPAGDPVADVVGCTVALQDEKLPCGAVVGGSLVLYASL